MFGGPGCYLGSFVSLPIGGAACNGSTVSRWHLTFYISGGLAVAWSALWAWIARSSPSRDPSLTQEEREYVSACEHLLSYAPGFVVVVAVVVGDFAVVVVVVVRSPE